MPTWLQPWSTSLASWADRGRSRTPVIVTPPSSSASCSAPALSPSSLTPACPGRCARWQAECTWPSSSSWLTPCLAGLIPPWLTTSAPGSQSWALSRRVVFPPSDPSLVPPPSPTSSLSPTRRTIRPSRGAWRPTSCRVATLTRRPSGTARWQKSPRASARAPSGPGTSTLGSAPLVIPTLTHGAPCGASASSSSKLTARSSAAVAMTPPIACTTSAPPPR